MRVKVAGQDVGRATILRLWPQEINCHCIAPVDHFGRDLWLDIDGLFELSPVEKTLKVPMGQECIRLKTSSNAFKTSKTIHSNHLYSFVVATEKLFTTHKSPPFHFAIDVSSNPSQTCARLVEFQNNGTPHNVA